MRKLWSLFLVFTILISFLFAFQGCENDPSMTDLDRYFEEHPYASDPRASAPDSDVLSLSPSEGNVSITNQLVSFKVDDGYAPYTWGVANTVRGSITVNPENSDSAVYKAIAVADNTVIVTDNGGRSAVANITVGSADALQIVQQSVTIDIGQTYQYDAIGGVPPYTWSVNVGSAVATINNSGLYTSVAGVSTNTVYVVDADNSQDSVTIIQK